MDAMLLYDIDRDTLPAWLLPAGAALAAALPALGLVFHRRLAFALAGEIGRRGLWLALVALAGTALWLAAEAEARQRRLAALAAAPGPRTVEGPVTAFRAALTRRGPSGVERFTVGGVEFEYGPESPVGFARTRPNGGPVAPGVRLRVTWLQDGDRRIITRLEALR
jgi:hypothetical protein